MLEDAIADPTVRGDGGCFGGGLAQAFIGWEGKVPGVIEGRLNTMDHVKLLRLRDGELGEEDAVEKLKDSQVGADAEGEGEDGGESKAGRAEKLTEGVAGI